MSPCGVSCQNVRSWTPLRCREALNALRRGPVISAIKASHWDRLPGSIGSANANRAIDYLLILTLAPHLGRLTITVCASRRRLTMNKHRTVTAHLALAQRPA